MGVRGRHAFLWENGTMTDLGPPGPGGPPNAQITNFATAVNDSGEVVGKVLLGNVTAHAVLWTDHGAP